MIAWGGGRGDLTISVERKHALWQTSKSLDSCELTAKATSWNMASAFLIATSVEVVPEVISTYFDDMIIVPT